MRRRSLAADSRPVVAGSLSPADDGRAGRPQGPGTHRARPCDRTAKIERIAADIRQGVMTRETQFRHAWLRLFVSNVTVSADEVRISGPTEALAQLAAAGSVDALPAESSQFHRKWRPLGDSNPCYRRERAVS